MNDCNTTARTTPPGEPWGLGARTAPPGKGSRRTVRPVREALRPVSGELGAQRGGPR
jgi:hypothetical protein